MTSAVGGSTVPRVVGPLGFVQSFNHLKTDERTLHFGNDVAPRSPLFKLNEESTNRRIPSGFGQVGHARLDNNQTSLHSTLLYSYLTVPYQLLATC